MYLVGADHPNKSTARLLLERAIVENEPLETDAEVLQELLHRYTAIGRRDAIGPAWDAIVGVVDVIHPIELEDVTRAKRLVGSSASSGSALAEKPPVRRRTLRRHRRVPDDLPEMAVEIAEIPAVDPPWAV